MSHPDLTIGICIYDRPYYAIMTLLSLRDRLDYAGKKRFHLTGKMEAGELRYYQDLLNGYEVTVDAVDNLSAMVNSIARNGGDVWMTVADDCLLRYAVNLTPDIDILLTRSEIGCIRLACLSLWGSNAAGDPETNADLIMQGGLHWWRLDKERTKDNYMSGFGCHLFHRRYWDAYGDVPPCPPNDPGQAELNANARFRAKEGPTVAVPMRFGEDTLERPEPFWHFGAWHADLYAEYAKSRIRPIWFQKPGNL